jgi:hypothetical protein
MDVKMYKVRNASAIISRVSGNVFSDCMNHFAFSDESNRIVASLDTSAPINFNQIQWARFSVRPTEHAEEIVSVFWNYFDYDQIRSYVQPEDVDVSVVGWSCEVRIDYIP